MELGYPHPRYLDLLLTPADYDDWAAFMTWLYEEHRNGG